MKVLADCADPGGSHTMTPTDHPSDLDARGLIVANLVPFLTYIGSNVERLGLRFKVCLIHCHHPYIAERRPCVFCRYHDFEEKQEKTDLMP